MRTWTPCGRRDAADCVYVADASCHGAIGRRRVLQFGTTVPIIPGCRVTAVSDVQRTTTVPTIPG